MNDPMTINVEAIQLSPAQARWVESLPPGRRRRLDRLTITSKRYPQVPSVLVWLLELAEASPEVWNDPIIKAEVDGILGAEDGNHQAAELEAPT
jgi:hypothetical protein